MKRVIIVIVQVLFICSSLFSQTSRALVIGISQYKETGIPKLLFAHKDAEAFDEFLRSESGGNLIDANIKLLLNEDATRRRIDKELNTLINNSEEGDEVTIYFAGHGDVDGDSQFAPTYLLCYGAEPDYYHNGGFEIGLLDKKIKQLSKEKNVKVTLITDACKSGNLNRSSDATSSILNLEKNHNEIRMLSCGEGQVSKEGTKWGGGRGVFSYYLINGLYGMADTNNDSAVSLREIRLFLDQKIRADIPTGQDPELIGKSSHLLSNVDSIILKKILNQINGTSESNAPIIGNVSLPSSSDAPSGTIHESPAELISVNEDLTQLDTNVMDLSSQFYHALNNDHLLNPETESAYFFYNKIPQDSSNHKLTTELKEELILRLQDKPENLINKLIASRLNEDILPNQGNEKLLLESAQHLEKASELVGQDDDRFADFKSKSLFFLAKTKTDTLEKREVLHSALRVKKMMPLVFLEMITTFDQTAIDSAEYYATKARFGHPQWLMPDLYLHNFYENFDSFKALEVLENANSRGIRSPFYYWEKGNFYEAQNKFDLAIKYYEIVDSLKQNMALNIGKIVCPPCLDIKLTNNYIRLDQHQKATKRIKSKINEFPTNSLYYKLLAQINASKYEYFMALKEANTALEMVRHDKQICLFISDIYNAIGNQTMADDFKEMANFKIDIEDGWQNPGI